MHLMIAIARALCPRPSSGISRGRWTARNGAPGWFPIGTLATAAWLGLTVLVAGCEPQATAPPAPATAAPVPTSRAAQGSDAWLDDGRPQSGLPRVKLLVGPKELDVELAMTSAAIEKGVMWRTNIAETEGMLFVFGRPHQTAFWMKNVPIDIDVAYIDTAGVIREIHRLERQNTNPVPAKVRSILYALETAEGWFARHGIKPGTLVATEHGSLPVTFSSPRRP